MKVAEKKLTIPLEEAVEIVDSFAQHIGYVAVANIKARLRRLAEEQVECNVYDVEELHEDCTVQVLRSSVTGEVSVGWWKNERRGGRMSVYSDSINAAKNALGTAREWYVLNRTEPEE